MLAFPLKPDSRDEFDNRNTSRHRGTTPRPTPCNKEIRPMESTKGPPIAQGMFPQSRSPGAGEMVQ